jgi:hypothetical protein
MSLQTVIRVDSYQLMRVEGIQGTRIAAVEIAGVRA